jgi:hypothetical protein
MSQQIRSANPLRQYLAQSEVSIDVLYTLLLLNDGAIDYLYEKVMGKTEMKCDRFTKVMAIITNLNHLTTTASGKAKIPIGLKETIWTLYLGHVTEAPCYCCGRNQIKMTQFDAGHVIPESKKGPTTVENLRPICHSCNLAIHDKDMREWVKEFYPQSPLLSEGGTL